ncbi:MAG TPA: hypothetical protein VEW71_10095 [Allosphingosinicella sp.]|nr:hypothetical protein [Allosphingosinicella sp.]
MRAILVSIPLLLFAPGCGDAKAAGEIACQQRLAGSPARPASPPNPSERRLSSPFAAWNQYYREMALDGCTEGQRYQASALARISAELSDALQPFGDPSRTMKQAPTLRSNQAFMELQARIEGFERRREVIQKELERMTGEGR